MGRILPLPALAMMLASGTNLRGCAGPPSSQPGPLALELRATRTELPPGGETTFMLIVTNQGQQPARLQFASGQTYDFILLKGEQEVWRWSHDRMFTQALRSLTLGPGESLSYQETWAGRDNAGQPVPPGEYVVIGVLTISPEQRTEPVGIKVTP